MRLARLVVALAAPLLLASCFLSPGKFVSTLDIRKDRSFTFTYVGEIIAADPKVTSGSGSDTTPTKPAAPTAETIAQLLTDYEALLQSVVEQPDSRLLDIPTFLTDPVQV